MAAWNEARSFWIRCKMLGMLTGKSWTSGSFGFIAIAYDFRMKIGMCYHGFRVRITLKPKKRDAIWIVIDWLTKLAHFIPLRTNYSLEKLAEIYISEIVQLHGIPLSIILDRDPRFTSLNWWLIRTRNSSFGRYASMLHSWIWR